MPKLDARAGPRLCALPAALAPALWLSLSLGCSSGLFTPAPYASEEQSAAAPPRAALSSPTPATAAAPNPPSRWTESPAPGSSGPRPVLSTELQRLRRAAQVHMLRHESPPGPYAEPYAPLAAGATEPASTGAAEGEPAAPVAGHFVPIENEPALAHFHKALARLAAGKDEDGKVRILAYGASHTQGDTYTGYLRAYLQSRFGDGGQGFVLLGRVNKWYRTNDTRARHRRLTVHHARYRLDVRDEPLGLFGAALVGRQGGGFGEIVTSSDSPNTRFEVHYYKQRAGGDFSLRIDGETVARIATKSDTPGSGYHSFEAGRGRHTIRAQLLGNGPVRLFGITAETDLPGVVIDTLGIGGARIASSLRWHEATWSEALRHRRPDLVTFAYGTNEAMDTSDSLAAYERELRAVLTRLRRAAPDVSCVLIAPFDLPARGQGQSTTHTRLARILDAQRAVSKELGCGFWNGYAFMGGRGSIRRWASAKPPLASPDQIHLTRRGYVHAGIALGDALMRAYDLDPDQWTDPAAVATPSPPYR